MINQKIDKYTKSQAEGLLKIEAFLALPITKDLRTRVFVLSGKAGTGKTTIIKYALQKEIKQDQTNIGRDDSTNDMFNTPNVVGITMSHKAKSILSQSIHICATFASGYGLKMTYGEDGSISFERPKKAPYEDLLCNMSLKAIIHDECSMYDKNMLKLVLEETNPYTKIIFMGDAGQLPPVSSVGDEDSPVFSMDLPEANKHTLIERVRQTKDNPILQMSDIIYDQIFGEQDLQKVCQYFISDNLVDEKGYRTIQYSNFLKEFRKSSEDFTDTKVVAYKNKRVNEFNLFIRDFIHHKPDKQYIVGELISMNDSYNHKVSVGKKSVSKWICYNSDEYKIIDIVDSEIEGIKVHLLYVDKQGHKQLASIKDPYIPVVAKEGIAEYNKKTYFLSRNAKSALPHERAQKWKYFYSFTERFGNVSYAYSFTGYKVQGSGFKNVYIDVNDIITTGPISDKRKLQALYTGITRATHLVTFLKSNTNGR